MSITLKKLCSENGNPFKLTLIAGADSYRNSVSWAYVFEDEFLIRYLHGSELVVTTGIQQVQNPNWLMSLVQKIADHKAAGLIVNTGHFIMEIPQDVIDYCDAHELPLLWMPWEIHTTEMIQSFCTRIILEQQEDLIHDNTLRDVIMHPDMAEKNRDMMAKYYDPDGLFRVILIYTTFSENTDNILETDTELRFMDEIKKVKTRWHIVPLKVGLIKHQDLHILVLGNCPSERMNDVIQAIRNVYKEYIKSHTLFTGFGSEVKGFENLNSSYMRALTALRMSEYQRKPFIHFEDMGFYKILFSIREREIIYNYADDLLRPIDALGAGGEHYIELLKAYIENDRSLERTAAQLYIHRNTVNYQLQKLKALLNNPLKTVEDLFPYQVALAIRDMQLKEIN